MLTVLMGRVGRLATGRGEERGQALLFALIAVVLLASIPIAIATVTADQLPQTNRNLNYEAAYEAAQAGVNDYLQHLDANEAYGIYCKGCAAGTASNLAFTSWVQTATSPPEWYSYAAHNTSGTQLTLEVSGKAGTGDGTVVRTFDYAVTPASTLDDVYWTNYETRDPLIGALISPPPTDYQDCAVYYNQPDPYWTSTNGLAATGPPIPASCDVTFTTGDVLNGPIYSNDTFRMCGTPTFDSSVQSGNIYDTATGSTSSPFPTGPVWAEDAGCAGATPTFLATPQKVANETPRNAEDDITPARDYGCFITGGTGPSSLTPVNVTIALAVSGSTTRVTWSGTGASVDNASTNTNTCTSGLLASSLTSGLIFVNGNVTVTGSMTGALDIVTCATDTQTSCDDPGGVLSNITIPSSITYPSANVTDVGGQPASDSKDVLGLIAQNMIEVTATSTIEIDAALLALQDSFYVNNWTSGSGYGTLNVFGSIAQNFRGPVATTGGTGFVKNYNYDNSLQDLFPPFFLPPTGATWSPSSYEECAAGNNQSVLNTPSC